MANPLSENLVKGTVGELLAQLRLLQYGVQAAPPLKDTGNDLVALKGWVTKCIQVKTTAQDQFRLDNLPEKYHFALLVKLEGEGTDIYLDQTRIFLLTKEEIKKTTYSVAELENSLLDQRKIDEVFGGQ